MDIFTGPWIPVAPHGTRTCVTYLDLMAGRHEDAREIAHPIPEMRAWARMLLGALSQAVCPRDDADALGDALRHPVDVRVPPEWDRNRTLFDSPTGRFMQPATPDPARRVEHGTALVVFEESTTYGNTRTGRRSFQHPRRIEALCASCAVIATFGVQSVAPQGGRGYSPSVCGTGRFTTLPVWPTLRASAHAATLTARRVAEGPWREASQDAPPWAYRRASLPGDAISLLEGLFWTPRTLRWVEAPDGLCPLCGSVGARARIEEFAAGSRVLGGFWPCPWTPWRENPKTGEQWHVMTPTRPGWVELGGAVASVGATHVAPVVEQHTHDLGATTVELLLYGVRFDQTKWRGTLGERVTLHVAHAPRAERLAACADAALRALHAALRQGSPLQSSDGTIDYTFWRETEEAFHAALTSPTLDVFERTVRRTIWDLFRGATRMLATHPSHAERVAVSRNTLDRGLRRAFRDPSPLRPAPTEDTHTP